MLFLGTFVNRFGTFVLSFLAIYLTSKNYAPEYLEMTFLSYGFGTLAAAGVGGYLADRVGRRNTMAFSMFAAAVFTVGLGLAGSPFLIILFAGLVGFTAALYHPAANALIADLVPPDNASMRSRFFVLPSTPDGHSDPPPAASSQSVRSCSSSSGTPSLRPSSERSFFSRCPTASARRNTKRDG